MIPLASAACAIALAAAACSDVAPTPPRAAGGLAQRVPRAAINPDPAISNPRVAEAVRRIVAADDAHGMPFFVIDKTAAELYVFDKEGTLRAESAVLLGSARGDRTAPGVGDKPIEQVLPEERTTPAGRFIGERGINARHEDVVWVDYDAAVSMHRVITSNPKERRLERLRSPTPDDNRISYGCINVWPEFYETYVRPAYVTQRPPIYILPEIESFDSMIALRSDRLAHARQ
jgi:hypothetical protein